MGENIRRPGKKIKQEIAVQKNPISTQGGKKTVTEKSETWKFHHLGVIVRDLDKAIKYFQSLGIGPFVSNSSEVVTDRKVYGKPANIKLRGAGALLGPIKFEVIQPLEGNSVQKEFLDSKGEGINHIGFIVDDLEEEVKKLEERGFRAISTGKIPPNGGFAYMGTNEIGGVLIELVKKV
ncbi:MAG TPA: VOC family protein [Thermodesulfobacteriota bacterium]|nr:VOC family protein [Thermodesulfobacteriota bacterium]